VDEPGSEDYTSSEGFRGDKDVSIGTKETAVPSDEGESDSDHSGE
jgi:hypothetical protein